MQLLQSMMILAKRLENRRPRQRHLRRRRGHVERVPSEAWYPDSGAQIETLEDRTLLAVVGVATGIPVSPGQSVVVPVTIDDPTDVQSVNLTITYDTSKLDVTDSDDESGTSPDVTLGEVLSSNNFQFFQTNVSDAMGTIALTASATEPIESGSSGGSLFDITFTAKDGASGVATIEVDGELNDDRSPELNPQNGSIQIIDVSGDVDGDGDLDPTDGFLINITLLGATDQQIDAVKGASPLTATEIRTNIDALDQLGDVDGDGDFDPTDGFLINVTLLGATDQQINAVKGASPLTASEIRANVNALDPNNADSAVIQSTSSQTDTTEKTETEPLQILQTTSFFSTSPVEPSWNSESQWTLNVNRDTSYVSADDDAGTFLEVTDSNRSQDGTLESPVASDLDAVFARKALQNELLEV